jgi:hypothetical protein
VLVCMTRMGTRNLLGSRLIFELNTKCANFEVDGKFFYFRNDCEETQIRPPNLEEEAKPATTADRGFKASASLASGLTSRPEKLVKQPRPSGKKLFFPISKRFLINFLN